MLDARPSKCLVSAPRASLHSGIPRRFYGLVGSSLQLLSPEPRRRNAALVPRSYSSRLAGIRLRKPSRRICGPRSLKDARGVELS
jgi:hypothetical protein